MHQTRASLCRHCFGAVLATSFARLQAGVNDIMQSASGSKNTAKAAEGDSWNYRCTMRDMARLLLGTATSPAICSIPMENCTDLSVVTAVEKGSSHEQDRKHGHALPARQPVYSGTEMLPIWMNWRGERRL